MRQRKSNLKAIAFTLVAAFATLGTHAQMAQDPLLSRTAAVEPNIVFMFDDSGSMRATAMYQYGGVSSGMGMTGPGNLPAGLTSEWTNAPNSFHGKSPDVNLIYYDPRVTYKRRVNADGTFQAAGSTSGISSFNVYFYKPPATYTYGVSGVSVTAKGSGYPASGVAATFPVPPAGGVRATATVQTAATQNVSSVTVTNRGSGYPASGVIATFSAPPAGGIQAMGSVQTVTTTAVTSVTVTNRGRDYPASGVTATFGAPPVGGIQAAGTVNIGSTNKVSAVTVTNIGSGYTGSPTATFSLPAVGGVRATGLVNITQTGTVNSVTVVNGTGCFPNGVTVQFSVPQAPGGVRATADVQRAGNNTGCASGRRIASINMTNNGSGYTSTPTLTFSSINSGSSTFTVVMGTTGSILGITVTDPGSGYSSAPTITIGNAGGGSGASFSVALTATNWITGITMTNVGAGYASAPSLTLGNTGGGSGATFTVNTQGVRGISGITITNPGAGYTSLPTITLGGTGSGSGAVLQVNGGTTNVISGITITNPGSGYTTQPVLTLSGTSGGTGATFGYTYTSTLTPAVNTLYRGLDTPTAAINYFTPSYTPDAGSPLALSATVVAYPNTASASTTQYPKFRARTDCDPTVCTWAQELQNYANWKTYHSTRLDLAKTGIGLALQPLNPTFRLGWGTINGINDNDALTKGVRKYTPAVQSEFLSWLYARTAPGSTPNRRALDKVGKYYMRGDDAGPWADNPDGNSTAINVTGNVLTHASCRRSYAMLMTDGYYNDSFSLSDQDTSNGPTITSPSTYQYTPIGPYSDTIDNTTQFANTMADIAMKYWVTDLRGSISNSVRPVEGDEAFWQHMNFYAIGLGVVGTLDATDPAVLQRLTGSSSTLPPRSLSWPQPFSDTQTAIDDMWHATINGRGKLLNAKTAEELNSAVVQMMSDISGKEATQSGVAVSTASLTQGTKKYTPSYTSVLWNGNVTAYNLDPNNGNQTGVAWQVETLQSTDPTTGRKTYSSRMPDHTVRNIFVGNGATSGTRAVEFKHASMGALTGLMTGASVDLINYLRGDASKEDTSETANDPTAIFRARETRLGDIVNSTPVFVKDTLDLGYERLPSGFPGRDTYRAYVDGTGSPAAGGKKQRAEGLLFVGANDGMLHAFRDGTFDAQGNVINQGGVEVFAYVPHALLPSLHLLADKAYQHRYYVDGPNIETDAYIGGAWTNIVLGSTGAGAGVLASAGNSPRSAVYAINTTSLTSGANTLNASSVLWEVSSNQANFSELGYVLTDIQAGPSLNSANPWIAVFGNGYESKSCKAMLYVVNLQTGARIREIDTGVGSCAAGSRNGLGGVRVVRNAAQQIIGAYAGDLQGNVWKFNLNNSDSTAWGVDLGGSPLIKVGNTQSITAPPSVITLPAIGGPATGYQVIVGTGKFYEVSDITTTATQAFYSIWDPLAFGTATIPTGTLLDMAVAADRAKLVQQTVSASITGDNGNTYAAVSANPVDYTGGTPKRGCYLNFTQTGQRMVYPIDLLANRFAAADTISPSNVSLDQCVNETGGSSFLYFLDAFTCGAAADQILDTNGDGNVDTADALVSGVEGKADGRNVSLQVTGTRYVNVSGGSPGATLINLSCTALGNCATPAPGSVGIKSREWRQLFMR